MSLSISDPYLSIVNREQYLHEALSRLEAMLADKWVQDWVLFFHGPPQIGKTALLQEIQRQASRRGIPSAAVDFADRQPAPTVVAKQVQEEWARSADFVSSDSIAEGMTSEEAAQRLLNFTGRLSSVSLRRPNVLLLDSLEDGSVETLERLQDEILSKFIKDDYRILVVVASRGPLRQIWRPDLERRTARFALEPFTLAETDIQLRKSNAPEFIKPEALIEYTNGVPGLNEIAIQWWAGKTGDSENDLRARLVDAILRRIPPRLKNDLLTVSALWQFDRRLLEKVNPGRDPDQILNDLLDTHLINDSQDGYFKTVSPAVRPVLDAYLRHTQFERHRDIQKIAAEWVKQGDYGNIVSQVYYEARSGTSPDTIQSQLTQAFDGLENRSSRPRELATRLVRDLRDIVTTLPPDTATVLRQITEEYSAKFLGK